MSEICWSGQFVEHITDPDELSFLMEHQGIYGVPLMLMPSLHGGPVGCFASSDALNTWRCKGITAMRCEHGMMPVAGVQECPWCRISHLERVLRQIGNASLSFKPICDAALKHPPAAKTGESK